MRGERDAEEGVKAVLCIFKIRKEPAETRKGRERGRVGESSVFSELCLIFIRLERLKMLGELPSE